MNVGERAFSAHIRGGVPDASRARVRLLSHALVKRIELRACVHFFQSSIVTRRKHWVEIINTSPHKKESISYSKPIEIPKMKYIRKRLIDFSKSKTFIFQIDDKISDDGKKL